MEGPSARRAAYRLESTIAENTGAMILGVTLFSADRSRRHRCAGGFDVYVLYLDGK